MLAHVPGFQYKLNRDRWSFDDLVEAITPGARLEQPNPLFTKLDEQIIAQETAKLGL